jgi:hypothetical protein
MAVFHLNDTVVLLGIWTVRNEGDVIGIDCVILQRFCQASPSQSHQIIHFPGSIL